MSEIGEELVTIDESFMQKSTSNTVEIRVRRRNDEVSLESSNPPPPLFSTLHLLLKDIDSFDEDYMYLLLYPTLPDPHLCSILSFKIAYEAKRVQGPLYFSFNVTLSPPPILEEPEIEICPICLKEDEDLTEMSNCSHMFHDDCIYEWLKRNNTCPICRQILEDE